MQHQSNLKAWDKRVLERIYIYFDELKSLEKDPYKVLTKRYKSLKNALEEKEIEINIGSDKEGISKGFYTDSSKKGRRN